MSFRDMAAVVAVCVSLIFALSSGRGESAAELFAAQQDTLAQVALDSAAVWRVALADFKSEHADTLAAYGVRELERVREEAVDSVVLKEAVEAAGAASERVLATADSVTRAAFVIYRTERDTEVAVERRRRVRAEARAASLGVQVSQLTAGLRASTAETGRVRAAYASTKAAEDALARELASRGGEPWYWKAAAVTGWVCAAVCR